MTSTYSISDSSNSTETTIQVCQSSTCRSKGSEAVLVEIEELANLICIDDPNNDGNHEVEVEPIGCLGYCSQGPAIAVQEISMSSKAAAASNRRKKKKKTRTTIHVRINTFEKSAQVIKEASGIQDKELNNHLRNLPYETERRLSNTRKRRAREYAVSNYQWNRALQYCLDAYSQNSNQQDRDEDLKQELESILGLAGYHPRNRAILNNVKVHLPMPETIDSYVPWTLNAVHVVSSHSAIFKLSTTNMSRGTPHPRGRGRMASPITWHVTMLGEVGTENNDEGPLPWIERDYTPISGALEWERGKVEILIKIYNMGKLTSWLRRSRCAMIGGEDENENENDHGNDEHKNPDWDTNNDAPVSSAEIARKPQTIWLSKPIKTLSMPNLVPDQGDGFKPSSVLLLLAGTGIVALSQILAHRDPYRMLGIPTPKSKQLQCPIDLIVSCREDDLLLMKEIRDWCEEGKSTAMEMLTVNPTRRSRVKFKGLRNCTILITPGSSCVEGGKEENNKLPFPDYKRHGGDEADALLKELEENDVCTVRWHRMNKHLVAESMERMVEHQPCRVVVSGPDAFNQSARELLDECSFPTSTQLTVLSA